MQSYAIVKTGGKQYTVQTGDILRVELLRNQKEGDSVELPTLAAKTGDGLQLGAPELATKVTATIIDSGRGKKILVFRKKKRSTFRKKNGHRQYYHAIRIDSVPG